MTSERASNGSAPAKPVEPGTEQPDLAWGDINRRLVANYVYVNSQYVESGAPMPDVKELQTTVQGATCFAVLYAYKGYWQLGIDEESSNLVVIQVGTRLYQPKRTPQGGTLSAQTFQAAMHRIMGDDYIGQIVIIWADDFLIWADSPEVLLQRLRMVFQRAKDYGLKLPIKKAQFFTKEALWCGKIFSSVGVKHQPARIQGLANMPNPTTAAELMQFLAAANWMRDSIPEFAAIMRPLQTVLTKAMVGLKRRTKKAAAQIPLEGLWDDELCKTWTLAKEVLHSMATLANVDPDMALCAFPDASEQSWGLFISQLPREELHKAVSSTQHQPLAFVSGTFTKNQTNWPIVEKEGYATVQLDRIRYLLHGRRIHIFTDHRNLQYIWGGAPSNC